MSVEASTLSERPGDMEVSTFSQWVASNKKGVSTLTQWMSPKAEEAGQDAVPATISVGSAANSHNQGQGTTPVVPVAPPSEQFVPPSASQRMLERSGPSWSMVSTKASFNSFPQWLGSSTRDMNASKAGSNANSTAARANVNADASVVVASVTSSRNETIDSSEPNSNSSVPPPVVPRSLISSMNSSVPAQSVASSNGNSSGANRTADVSVATPSVSSTVGSTYKPMDNSIISKSLVSKAGSANRGMDQSVVSGDTRSSGNSGSTGQTSTTGRSTVSGSTASTGQSSQMTGSIISQSVASTVVNSRGGYKPSVASRSAASSAISERSKMGIRSRMDASLASLSAASTSSETTGTSGGRSEAQSRASSFWSQGTGKGRESASIADTVSNTLFPFASSCTDLSCVGTQSFNEDYQDDATSCAETKEISDVYEDISVASTTDDTNRDNDDDDEDEETCTLGDATAMTTDYMPNYKFMTKDDPIAKKMLKKSPFKFGKGKKAPSSAAAAAKKEEMPSAGILDEATMVTTDYVPDYKFMKSAPGEESSFLSSYSDALEKEPMKPEHRDAPLGSDSLSDVEAVENVLNESRANTLKREKAEAADRKVQPRRFKRFVGNSKRRSHQKHQEVEETSAKAAAKMRTTDVKVYSTTAVTLQPRKKLAVGKDPVHLTKSKKKKKKLVGLSSIFKGKGKRRHEKPTPKVQALQPSAESVFKAVAEAAAQ